MHTLPDQKTSLKVKETASHFEPPDEDGPSNWIYVQPVEVDLDSEHINENKLRKTAVEQLEHEIELAKKVYIQELQEMRARKDRLLAITHQANRAGGDE